MFWNGKAQQLALAVNSFTTQEDSTVYSRAAGSQKKPPLYYSKMKL